MKRAMFYCQHVLGMGHLVRSMEIVRGLSDFEVCFLNGGEAVDGFALSSSVRTVNLPPLRSDKEFRGIQSAGETSLSEVKEERKQIVLREYDRMRPDVVIMEMFPFGRRNFAFELVPLLETIRSQARRTAVVCSLRDILVSKRDQTRFEEQTCGLMNEYFDLLLVHADPAFQKLEETFPKVREIRCPIRYTGFVARKPNGNGASPQGDAHGDMGPRIVVSVGGGRVGSELLECAIDASERLAPSVPHQMLVFTGPFLPDNEFQRLRERAATNSAISLERFTTCFQSQLARASVSVSMAGYNTCMDIIVTGVQSLVLPFTGNNNEEQSIRARKLQDLGVVTVLEQRELTPQSLAAKIAALLERKAAPSVPALDLCGTENTAAIIRHLVQT